MVINSPSVRSGLGRSHAPSRMPSRLPVAPSRLAPPLRRPMRTAPLSPYIPRRGSMGLGPIGVIAGLIAGVLIWRLSSWDTDPRFRRVGNQVYFNGSRYTGVKVGGVPVKARDYYTGSLAPSTHPWTPPRYDPMESYFTIGPGADNWQTLYSPWEPIPGAPSYADWRAPFLMDVPPYPGNMSPGPSVLIPPPLPFPGPVGPSPGSWRGLPPPFLNPSPGYRRMPGPRPGPRPGRDLGGGLTLDKSPNALSLGGLKVGRPPRGTRERKVRHWSARVLSNLLEYGTEGLEIIEILLDASGMVRNYEDSMLDHLWRFFSEGWYENLTPEDVWDLYANVTEDRGWGMMFSDIAAQFRSLGITGGVAL